MKIFSTLILVLIAFWSGCVTQVIRPVDDIPVEQSYGCKAMTPQENASLVALARTNVPGREVQFISLTSLYDHGKHNHTPVATVIFQPVKLDRKRYEFTSLTVLNHNWPSSSETNRVERTVPPETCWYLKSAARQDEVKYRFQYRTKSLFLFVGEDQTYEEVRSILDMMKPDNVFDLEGKAIEDIFTEERYGGVATHRYNSVKRYTKDGVTFIEVAWMPTGGYLLFKIVGNKLVQAGIGGRCY
jgi:hypothetical protein